MKLYHGGLQAVESPRIIKSELGRDFGFAFYTTDIREQAERWARRKAALAGGRAAVSQYQMDEDMNGLRVKRFPEDLAEWIEFVCDCRDGKPVYLEYDLVIGKVADDKVFRVVDMYHSCIWDKERALMEIRAYPNYDQLAFISQTAIDRLLRFERHLEV